MPEGAVELPDEIHWGIDHQSCDTWQIAEGLGRDGWWPMSPCAFETTGFP